MPYLLLLCVSLLFMTPIAFGEPTTPRQALSEFLQAGTRASWGQAAQSIQWPARVSSMREREQLSRQLYQLIDAHADIYLPDVSDLAEGSLNDGLPADMEVVGTLRLANTRFQIEMVRSQDQSDPKAAPTWKLHRKLIQDLSSIRQNVVSQGLGQWMPPWVQSPTYLGLKLWQWIGLALGIPLALLLGAIATSLVRRILSRSMARGSWSSSAGQLPSVLPALRFLLAFLILATFYRNLGLPIHLRQWLAYAESVFYTWGLAWLGIRLTALAAKHLKGQFEAAERRAAVAMVPPIQKAANVFIVVVALLLICHNLGFNVTALLAGLGVGGLAVALAGQKTIENLFGGISIILDQPVRVGEFCNFGTYKGTVEDIGLRSTRIRTLDRTLISVPNAEFAQQYIENVSKRDKIRFAPILGVRYETTAKQMQLLLQKLRDLLASHEMVAEEPRRVRFVSLGDFSLNIEILAYITTSDYNEYLNVAEELNLRIMSIVEECGTDFAFPSQTTYVERSPGLDPAKIAAAEAAFED